MFIVLLFSGIYSSHEFHWNQMFNSSVMLKLWSLFIISLFPNYIISFKKNSSQGFVPDFYFLSESEWILFPIVKSCHLIQSSSYLWLFSAISSATMALSSSLIQLLHGAHKASPLLVSLLTLLPCGSVSSPGSCLRGYISILENNTA